MDEDAPTEDRDPTEIVRLVIVWTLIAVNCWMVYDMVKDRPDVVILRNRVRDAVLGPWKRYRELRRAEKRTVWEAIEVVTEKEDQP